MEKDKNECRTLSLIHLVGKKWTVPIMELFPPKAHAMLHFNSIQSRTGMTPRTLSKSLDELCAAGIISKSKDYSGYAGYYLTGNGAVLQTFIRSAKELGIQLYGIDRSCTDRKCADCAIFESSLHYASSSQKA